MPGRPEIGLGAAVVEDPRAVGLRVIVVYKIGKAIVQATLAAALPLLRALGVTAHLGALTAELAEHVAHHWTEALARLIAKLLTPNHLTLISAALGLDAALSAFEAWALVRRYRWAPWLVVIASATLIPFEIYELTRRVRLGRVTILAVNLIIIAYLARRAFRERRES